MIKKKSGHDPLWKDVGPLKSRAEAVRIRDAKRELGYKDAHIGKMCYEADEGYAYCVHYRKKSKKK